MQLQYLDVMVDGTCCSNDVVCTYLLQVKWNNGVVPKHDERCRIESARLVLQSLRLF